MEKLKPTDYITEARRLACEKDAKSQRVAKKARRYQKCAVMTPVAEEIAVTLFAKAARLEQEAAVLRWLATYVETHEGLAR